MSRYGVLGVEVSDTIEHIKKQYKQKALMYHPDNKNTGDAEMFMKLRKEYGEVVERKSGEEERTEYDFRAVFGGFNKEFYR